MYGPEIGDMDEGIVEGCENSGNPENELSCALVSTAPEFKGYDGAGSQSGRICEKGNIFTISNLGAEGDVLLGGACSFLWRHGEFVVLSDLLLFKRKQKVRGFGWRIEEIVV